jgi:ABC-2 type transport system ATP-binding protein
MIEVNELTKSYGDRNAIRGVSFAVKRGEILGFLGPNGAGKSTTMKILSGFIPATGGTATINGYDVAKNPHEAKASLGYLPENPPVYMGMSVEDYLDFAARLHGVPSPKVKAAITDAMGKCGIADVKKRLIGNLSKGYRQRVGLAQAIAHNPPVLILDEPTVGLDPRQIIDIRNLIQSLGGDHTVILSTHILPEVQATCSRVVVIDKGTVVAQDTLQGIAARMTANSRLLLQLSKNPGASLSKLKSISGVVNITPPEEQRGEFTLHLDCAKDSDPRAAVAELCVKEGFGLLGLAQEKISLEDAFVRLITKENHQ